MMKRKSPWMRKAPIRKCCKNEAELLIMYRVCVCMYINKIITRIKERERERELRGREKAEQFQDKTLWE